MAGWVREMPGSAMFSSEASRASAGRNRLPPLPIRLAKASARGAKIAESTERNLCSTWRSAGWIGANRALTSEAPL